jgi:hypothetical protein
MPASLSMPRRGLLSFLLLACAGCATINSATKEPSAPAAIGAASCAAWLAAADRAVSLAGVADAGGYRVPGFAYLRVDRFIASFAQESASDPVLFNEWTSAARAEDSEARSMELRNLPAESIASLGFDSPERAIAHAEACAEKRMHVDFADPSLRAKAAASAKVPDDYSPWSRALGLYPVMRIPFAKGVEQWHDEAVEAFRRHALGEGSAVTSVQYAPGAAAPLAQSEIAGFLSAQALSPLQQVALSSDQLDRLFRTFAPTFEVETDGDFDRVGEVRLQAGLRPAVDTSHPVVYRRLTYTRFNGEVLPQLVYTAWFPQRPAESALDVLAGNLDGMVFRVTLGRDGAPLVYDTIHPCGCYHMFFPAGRLHALPAPDPADEWIFVPTTMPEVRPGQRVTLHVQARSHYLTGISVAEPMAPETYAIVDENLLRSLPVPGGGRHSLYSPDGLVAGSERLERFLFWPMGVPSAGTMRQWGHHATAFLGIRHFDDPYLMQDRFTIASQ